MCENAFITKCRFVCRRAGVRQPLKLKMASTPDSAGQVQQTHKQLEMQDVSMGNAWDLLHAQEAPGHFITVYTKT